MLTLALDASAGDATIAILDDHRLLVSADAALRDRHVDALLPAVVSAIGSAGIRVNELGRVVCGEGPGGFTALRLAAATAKGIARATSAELWVAPSLALIAAGAEPPLASGSYLSLLDALRGECYAAPVIVADGIVTRCGAFARIARTVARAQAMNQNITLIGPDEDRALRPHARGVARLAVNGGLVRRVPVADWEPTYGRLAEAQVRWELAHQRALPTDGDAV